MTKQCILIPFLLVVGLMSWGQTMPIGEMSREQLIQYFEELEHSIDDFEYYHFDSSLYYAHYQVLIGNQLNDFDLLSRAHHNLGIFYEYAGLLDKSVESHYLSLAYIDSSDVADKAIRIASTYHHLAWDFVDLGEKERAAPLFHKSISIRGLENKSDSIWRAKEYFALGSHYYIDQPLYDSAIFYIQKALALKRAIPVPMDEIAQVLVELINAYCFSDKFVEAEKYLLEIQTFPQDSLSAYSKAYILYDMGLIDVAYKRYNTAIQKFEEVYDGLITMGLGNTGEAINLLEQLINAAEKQQVYHLAFQYANQLRETERNSFLRDRKNVSKALEIIYETDKKEQLIQQQQENLANQSQIIYLVTVFSVLAIMLVAVIWISSRKIKAKNRHIETLMRELHHRVKNNLQVISSLLGLQSMKLEDASAKKAVAEGKARIRAMSLIHQKLYQNDEVTSLNIRDYITNLVDELTQSYGFADKAKVVIDVPSISFDADTSLPIGLIINELVSNAFKYAYQDIEEPILELKLLQDTAGYFRLSIRDNGKGFPEKFNIDEATSLGMRLVTLLVKQLKGQMQLIQDNGLECQIRFAIK